MCLCVCVHMHTFVYVCLYASQHMCAYMWCQRPIPGCPVPLLATCFCYYCCLFACFWGRASHFCLELIDLSSLLVQWVQKSTCSYVFRAIIMSLCFHIHLLLFGFLGSSSGLHACTESIFYPLSYLPSPHWKGSLQTHIGEKGNLIGKKKKVFLDKVPPYGFSTNTPIMTCCEKEIKRNLYQIPGYHQVEKPLKESIQ